MFMDCGIIHVVMFSQVVMLLSLSVSGTKTRKSLSVSVTLMPQFRNASCCCERDLWAQ